MTGSQSLLRNLYVSVYILYINMCLDVDAHVSSINCRTLYMVYLLSILALLYLFYSFVNKKPIHDLPATDGFGWISSP